jgi:SRSO17 transposase
VKGKPANCQAVVTAEYIVEEPKTKSIVHWPVCARLYLPESWIADTKRRERAHVPSDVPAQTKQEIALQLIDQALQWQVPFNVIVADAGYGRNAGFLKGLEERKLRSVCGVECTFGVRRPEEVALAQWSAPPPRTRKNGRPRKAHPAPLYTVQQIIAKMSDEQWQTITWREGSRGAMRKQFVAVRMRLHNRHRRSHTRGPACLHRGRGLAHRERPLPGEEGECKYSFSNLPAEMRLEQLVPFVRGRWPIEQFYEEARAANVAWMTIKDDAGMACIVILPWSCWHTVSLCMNGCKPRKTLQDHLTLAIRNALLFQLFIETSCSGSSRTWYSGGLPPIM